MNRTNHSRDVSACKGTTSVPLGNRLRHVNVFEGASRLVVDDPERRRPCEPVVLVKPDGSRVVRADLEHEPYAATLRGFGLELSEKASAETAAALASADCEAAQVVVGRL